MPFLAILVSFLVIVAIIRLSKKSSGAPSATPLALGRSQLLATGNAARGLILRAARTATRTTVDGQRFEVRSVVLDVEVPGQAPYEVSFDAMFPRLCEPFPGAALDLRIDPSDPRNVVIVGNAGSSAWMGAAPWLFPQPTGPLGAVPGASSGAGCGTAFVIVVSAFLAIGAVVSFVTSAASTSESPAASPAAPPTHASPPSHASPTGHAPAISEPSRPICDEAARCCKTLGRANCATFASRSENACGPLLKEEIRAATKAGKTCE